MPYPRDVEPLKPSARGWLSRVLAAAAIVALGDGARVFRAWGSIAERAAALGAIACLWLTAACALVLVRAAIARLPGVRRKPGAATVIAAELTACALGVGLADTHLLHALFGRAATVVVLLALTLGAALLARLEPVALWRAAFLAVGVGLIAVDLFLPARLWLAPRALLVALGAWLLARALLGRAPPPERSAPLAFAVGGAGAIAAVLLLGASPAVRFIVLVQAPATSAELDALAWLRPHDVAAAARAPAAPDEAARSSLVFPDANLLIITVDALRADRPLPETDAAQPAGARFTHAYAQAPHTAFSVTSLLTSTFPARLSAGPPTAAELLAGRQWFTDAFYPAGLFFDGRGRLERYAGRRFGFDWTDTRTLDARELTDAVLERLHAPRWRSQPRLFTWVHYFDPHEPYLARDGLSAEAPPRARYDSEVAYTDRELARLLRGLSALLRPTVVLLTADHGEEFGEHGGAYHGTSLYEEQVRVPLRIFIAGGVVGGELPAVTIDTPVELTDVVPTALALVGEPPPPSLEGRSLLPLLTSVGGEREDERAPRDVHAEEHTRRMLVRDGWKLVHDQHGDVDELYDLARDPAEHQNRIAEERALGRSLRAALDQWFALPSAEALIARLRDPRAPAPERAAAARALAELQSRLAAPSLIAALEGGDGEVRAEAALALAELANERARAPLAALLTQPTYRKRAALALGHLRDGRAVPVLVEATRDIDVTTRRHALHYLGFLAPAELVPAIAARGEEDLKVRADAWLALGRICARTGDAAAAQLLTARFGGEPQDDARRALAWAIGLCGERHPSLFGASVVAELARAATLDPTPPFVTEALVRLRTFDRSPLVHGRDFACWRRTDEQRFAGATTCPLTAPRLQLSIARARRPSVLLLRGRALGDRPLQLRVLLDGAQVGTLTLPVAFAERRLPLPAGSGRALVTLESESSDVLAELDHLLVVDEP